MTAMEPHEPRHAPVRAASLAMANGSRSSRSRTRSTLSVGCVSFPRRSPIFPDPLVGGLVDDSAPVPSIETAADGRWLMAVDVCGDRFADDAIEEGPPFMNS